MPVIEDYPLELKTHTLTLAEKERFRKEKAIFQERVRDIAEQVLRKAFGR